MASDWFVYWKERKPTRKEVQIVLEDFFTGVATKIEWDQDRFFIDLVGKPRSPFYRLSEAAKRSDDAFFHEEEGFDVRCLEVWLGADCLDIMTRHQDELTNTLATGLARAFARFWGGSYEDDAIRERNRLIAEAARKVHRVQKSGDAASLQVAQDDLRVLVETAESL